MDGDLHKVTAFVLRERDGGAASGAGRELLLFKHPYAGIQFPAGTVEPGEDAAAAALREAREETGLDGFGTPQFVKTETLGTPPDVAITRRATTAYSRPDTTSFDWARLPRAAWVQRLRQAAGFTQVTYFEHDDTLDPHYISFQITGWVRDDDLTDRQTRHFFVLTHPGATPDEWTACSDNHTFTLRWWPLAALPPIQSPQDAWVPLLLDYLQAAASDG